MCVTLKKKIGCDELWFHTGIKDRVRYIPANKVLRNLGTQVCKALPVFHALTGCDSTSALSGIGKKKAWKVLTKSTVFQESLESVGQSFSVDDQMAKKAEAFICTLYTVPDRTPSTSNEDRYLMFC